MDDCSCFGASCFESGDEVQTVHVGGGPESLDSPQIATQERVLDSNSRGPVETDLGTSVERTDEDEGGPHVATEGTSSSTPRLLFGAMAMPSHCDIIILPRCRWLRAKRDGKRRHSLRGSRSRGTKVFCFRAIFNLTVRLLIKNLEQWTSSVGVEGRVQVLA